MTGCRWLVFALTVLLYACGGGGSSPGEEQGDGSENQNPVQSDQSESDDSGIADGVEDQSDTGNSGDSDTSGSASNGDDNSGGSDDTDDTDDQTSDDSGNGEAEENSETAGLQANIIAAELGPAPGLAGETLGSIDQVSIVASGTVAFSASNSARKSFVWHGPVAAPAVLFRDGLSIGSDEQLPYQNTLSMALADDGSLGLIASANTRLESNRQDDTAFVVARSGNVDVVIKTGQGIAGPLNEDFVAGSVESMRHSNGGSLIVVNPQDRSNRPLLLLSQAGELEQIAEWFSSTFSAAGYLLPNGCRFVVSNRASSDLTVGRNYDIANDGTLVLLTNLFAGDSNTECAGSAVVRRTGGQYEIVVTAGQAVPGAPGSTFESLDIHSILADGSIVVLAGTKTATGDLFGANKWSWWLFRKNGEAALIALAGEEFEIGESTSVFPDNFGYSRWPGNRLQMNNSQAAFRLDNVPVPDPVVQDLTADIIFAGAIHTGQPHAELLAPGMAALKSMVVSGAASYPTFADGSYFSAISDPVAAPGDEWLFAGTYVNATVGGEGRSGIWRVSTDTEPKEIVSVGETVVLSGLERELTSVYSTYSNNYRSAAPLMALSDGSIVFLGAIDRRSDALVHVIPATANP